MDELEHMRRLLDQLGAEVPLWTRMWTPNTLELDAPVPMDVEGYLSLDQYADLKPPPHGVGTPENVIREILGSYKGRELLVQLAYLNRLCDRSEAWAGLIAYYRRILGHLGSALDTAMSMMDGKIRIVARQPVLIAMRELLREPLVDDMERKTPPLVVTLLLTHAVGSTLENAQHNTGEMLGSYPAYHLIDTARNAILYENDDPGAVIARTWRLWQEYEPSKKKLEQLAAKPKELLREATGLEFESLMAMGFAVWSYSQNQEPGTPTLMRPGYFDSTPVTPDQIEAFLQTIASTPDEIRQKIKDRKGPYDLLPIQSKPLLRTDDWLLILDSRCLFDRFTLRGLYWTVHDYLKFDLKDECRRASWSEGHSEMVEEMVEDELRSMAPALLDGPAQAFYDEKDFEKAFKHKGQVCDAGIDYGDRFALFEIVDRQLTNGTRIEGKVSAFKSDTEKSVVCKCHQLDATSKELLKNPRALTKSPPVTGMKIVPVLIVAGGYPSDPETREYVEWLIHSEKGLLRDCFIEKLAILNLSEVEMLEALATTYNIARIITDWRSSPLHNRSLWNYLPRRFKGEELRPKRIKDQIEEVFDEFDKRLQTSRNA